MRIHSRNTKKKSKYKTFRKKRKGGFRKTLSYLRSILFGRTKQPIEEKTKLENTSKKQSNYAWITDTFMKHKRHTNSQSEETESPEVSKALLEILPPTPQRHNPYETNYEVRAEELANTEIETETTSEPEISNEIDALAMVENDPDALRFVSKTLFENPQFLKKIQLMYSKKKSTNLAFRINYPFFFDHIYTGFVSNPIRLLLSDRSSYGVYKTGKGNVVYSGLWKNNEFIEGTKLNKHEGFFAKGKFNLNGQLEGEGILKSSNAGINYTYFGNFVKGNFQGQGKLVGDNGNTLLGLFENDNLKHGSISYYNGYGDKGTFKNNKLYGEGLKISNYGKKIVKGNYQDGELLNGVITIVAIYGKHQLSFDCKFENNKVREDEYYCTVDNYFRLLCRVDKYGDIINISNYLDKSGQHEVDFDSETPKVDVRLFQHCMGSKVVIEDQESFLKMCCLYHTEAEINAFKKSITPDDTIRLIALCHGSLLKNQQLLYDVRRISSVPPGACSFSSFRGKMDYFDNALKKDTDEFIQASLDSIKSTVREMCNYVTIEKEDDTSEQKQYNTRVKLYKKRCQEGNLPGQNKTFHKSMMFNKHFSKRGRGLNMVLLYHNGKFVNLLSQKEDIKLFDIINTDELKYKHCVIADYSCSLPADETITEEDLDLYGGTKNKKKRRHRGTFKSI